MDSIFSTLLPEEYAELKQAIPLITVLIGGADGNLDSKERSWAEKVTDIRTYSLPEEYREYYQEVDKDLDQQIDTLMAELPTDVENRQLEISRRLSRLNPILAKLHPRHAAEMYDEFLSFARHVARASGGFLNAWSISKEEKRWLGLPMIDKFEWHGEEE